VHRGIPEFTPLILQIPGHHADDERGSCPIAVSQPQKSPDVSGLAWQRRREPLLPRSLLRDLAASSRQ